MSTRILHARALLGRVGHYEFFVMQRIEEKNLNLRVA
jgi:hypothetical protein